MQNNCLLKRESPSIDWTTILAATRAIAAEVEVKPLLATLLRVVLANTGARKAVLILSQEDDWIVKVIGQNYPQATFRFPDQTVTESLETPQNILHYVINTHAAIILNQPNSIYDPYFKQRSPLSLLCIPLLRQSDLIGLLYLENPLEFGAFTDQHSNFVQLLAAQGVISLKNV